jgi:glycosyltransferase involved in cell wall biosynthesis
MMLFGETPCDGVIDTKRCVACALTGLGVPKPLACAVAVVPNGLRSRAATFAGQFGTSSALRIPSLIASGRRRFLEFISEVDHVVAVSQWVNEVLTRNAVSVEKVTLCRQGVSAPTQARRSRGLLEQAGPLKIAYFGRIDYTKGPDLLGRALNMMPEVAVKIDIFAIRQSAEPDQVYDFLRAHARQDARLALRTGIAPDAVTDLMADYDLIAVPSRWLESGPLVALEAFAAGVPVIGANLGGIAELVRDGVDGVLVTPDDAAAWAATIRRLVNNRHLIDAMRARIEPPRTMNAVADDMAQLYAKVLARS